MYFRRTLSIVFLLCAISPLSGAHIPEGNFKKGFASGVRRLSQVKELFLPSAPKILHVHNKSELKRFVTFQFSSLENTRGIGGKRAYLNQDRSFVGSLAGKTCLAVFDGHGEEAGGIIAQFVRDALPIKILGYKSAKVGAWSGCAWMQTQIEQELVCEGIKGGTTAIVGVLEDDLLTIANIGDSRAVGILKDKVLPLSVDHKPSNKEEKNRVSRAGGAVYNGYVFANQGQGLAITRSFGGLLAHKNEVLVATPDIKTFKIFPGDILVFASDGLWDVFSNEDVATFIKENMSLGELRENTATKLSLEARSRGSRDDITVLIAIIK